MSRRFAPAALAAPHGAVLRRPRGRREPRHRHRRPRSRTPVADRSRPVRIERRADRRRGPVRRRRVEHCAATPRRRRPSALPPLLASAERLAASVVLGAHGRRRAGVSARPSGSTATPSPGDPYTDRSTGVASARERRALCARDRMGGGADSLAVVGPVRSRWRIARAAKLPRKGDRSPRF